MTSKTLLISYPELIKIDKWITSTQNFHDMLSHSVNSLIIKQAFTNKFDIDVMEAFGFFVYSEALLNDLKDRFREIQDSLESQDISKDTMLKTESCLDAYLRLLDYWIKIADAYHEYLEDVADDKTESDDDNNNNSKAVCTIIDDLQLLKKQLLVIDEAGYTIGTEVF